MPLGAAVLPAVPAAAAAAAATPNSAAVPAVAAVPASGPVGQGTECGTIAVLPSVPPMYSHEHLRYATERHVHAPFSPCRTVAVVHRYGHEHAAVDLQQEAVYGLTEVYRDAVKGARLLANPGCYPTCSQLPLYPLIKVGRVGERAFWEGGDCCHCADTAQGGTRSFTWSDGGLGPWLGPKVSGW